MILLQESHLKSAFKLLGAEAASFAFKKREARAFVAVALIGRALDNKTMKALFQEKKFRFLLRETAFLRFLNRITARQKQMYFACYRFVLDYNQC